jgi:hypothetical protein
MLKLNAQEFLMPGCFHAPEFGIHGRRVGIRARRIGLVLR